LSGAVVTSAAALAYIVLTAPLLFWLYVALGRRYMLQGTVWRFTKIGLSLIALSILWMPILHVGVPGKQAPFGYVFSAFYAVVIGVVYVLVDRYVQPS
jgi:Na+-transporting NADH:ubiquinone oxidoreductase subunit NqrB